MIIEIRTSWGVVRLAAGRDLIRRIELPLPPDPLPEFRCGRAFSPPECLSPVQQAGREYVRACLQGRFVPVPPHRLPEGPPFQRKVWQAIKSVSRGNTRTYGQVAAMAGVPSAARAAGSACRTNPLPLIIPCHRIVAAHGYGGFNAGLPWKKLLLRLEGAI